MNLDCTTQGLWASARIDIFMGFQRDIGFPYSSVSKESLCNAGDLGYGKSPREGNDNPLQYFCLKNPLNRGAWQTTIHGGRKSWTQLSD